MMSENQDSQGENLPSTVSQKAMKLLMESGNCAQTTFAILNEEHMFRKIPREMMIKASGNEYFIQVHPLPDKSWTQDPLPDLFAGL